MHYTKHPHKNGGDPTHSSHALYRGAEIKPGGLTVPTGDAACGVHPQAQLSAAHARWNVSPEAKSQRQMFTHPQSNKAHGNVLFTVCASSVLGMSTFPSPPSSQWEQALENGTASNLDCGSSPPSSPR